MVTHVLDDLSLDGDGHTAYPPGACSPVHPSGCLRCLEAENMTLSAQLGEAQSEAIKLSVSGHKQKTEIEALRAQVENLEGQLGRLKDRLIHAEANYGEELKRARAFEAQAEELAALLAKK